MTPPSFIDVRRGDAGAATVWQSILSGRLTASFCVLTAFELWIALGISHEEEAFYQSAFSFLEEADITRTASITAAIWLRGFTTSYAETLARDALIAAVALERDEPVYTRNVRDFRRFPGRFVRTDVLSQSFSSAGSVASDVKVRQAR